MKVFGAPAAVEYAPNPCSVRENGEERGKVRGGWEGGANEVGGLSNGSQSSGKRQENGYWHMGNSNLQVVDRR